MASENGQHPPQRPATERCHCLFRGLTVYDGITAAEQVMDVAIEGDRIVAVGNLDGWVADEVVAEPALALCPGFIDVHTHDDRAVLSDPDMAAKVSQGVTTVIVGNCGVSLAPLQLDRYPPPPLDALGDQSWFGFPSFRNYTGALTERPAAVNVGCLVGHTTLRVGVMDRLDRAATSEEVHRMCALVEESLEGGAIGLSSGLFYPPANAAPAAELVPLARIVADRGGIYTAHVRDEADDIVPALQEAVEIAADAGVELVLSHHKVAGVANFGRTRETLPLIARARTRQPIGLDVYPYAASSTMLNHASRRASARTLVTWSSAMPNAAGRDLAEIARSLGVGEEEALERLQPGGAVYFMMDEADVQRVLAFPDTMVGSDGLPHDPRPHPRQWGTFPRVLGHYARGLGLLSMGEAVRRMTSVSAARFRLADRGVIAPGALADLVVFDPGTVGDVATYEDPIRASRGILQVFVNGTRVWQADAPTGARPGRVLSRGRA